MAAPRSGAKRRPLAKRLDGSRRSFASAVYNSRVAQPDLKLVEECIGTGAIESGDARFANVQYRVSRFQGMTESGLPIPGLHRTEGSVDVSAIPESAALVGSSLTLRLEDGRALILTLAEPGGRVLSVGHGPRRCLCC